MYDMQDELKASKIVYKNVQSEKNLWQVKQKFHIQTYPLHTDIY